jgi:hypothetical protein
MCDIILPCHVIDDRNALLTQFRRQCCHTFRIDVIGSNLADFLNKTSSDREPDA